MSENRRKGLSITRQDGSTTFMPDLGKSEQQDLMRKAGLGKLVDGDARMNPMDLLVGLMKFEQLAGIEHTDAPEEDALDLPDDPQSDEGVEP